MIPATTPETLPAEELMQHTALLRRRTATTAATTGSDKVALAAHYLACAEDALYRATQAESKDTPQ